MEVGLWDKLSLSLYFPSPAAAILDAMGFHGDAAGRGHVAPLRADLRPVGLQTKESHMPGFEPVVI